MISTVISPKSIGSHRHRLYPVMAAIQGGTFLMGPSFEELQWQCGDKNWPQHPVTVPSFFISQTPITQAQWRFVVELPPSTRNTKEVSLSPSPSRFKGENRPVESVNWFEAVEFCARLSEYTGVNYRLPTEAEWEYACRAETTTPFHFVDAVAFGKAMTSRQTNALSLNDFGQTTPVGQFSPNGFGLYDMHGNVWEWCHDDWHDSYEGAPTDGTAWVNPENAEGGTEKILRGGSWSSPSITCRSAVRGRLPPSYRDSNNGLRVACTANLNNLQMLTTHGCFSPVSGQCRI